MFTPITPAEINAALEGTDPPGLPISAMQLGKELQQHRKRNWRAYSPSTIYTYRSSPDIQSQEFADAFRSWRAARLLRQQDLARVVFGDLTADQLLAEQGRILILGEGDVRFLVGIAALPPGALIQANGDGIARVVEARADVIACGGCGRPIVRRSWNHRFCSTCRPK